MIGSDETRKEGLLIGIPSSEDTLTTLNASLGNLTWLALPRIGSALYALVGGYMWPRVTANTETGRSSRPLNHSTQHGLPLSSQTRNDDDEDEDVVVDKPLNMVVKSHVLRIPFCCEACAFVTGIALAAKSLSRLNVEIGVYGEARLPHPLLWMILLGMAVCCLVEATMVDSMHQVAEQIGQLRRDATTDGAYRFLQWASSGQPPSTTWEWINYTEHGDDDKEACSDEAVEDDGSGTEDDDESDSQSDNNDKRERVVGLLQNAGLIDLIRLCSPDKSLVCASLLCMTVGGVANVCIPKLTGNLVDALVNHTDSNEVTAESAGMANTPDFVRSIELLVAASLIGGFFSGAREALSEVIGSRVNTRLRMRLMDSLLSQEIGFFDEMRTGDLSSRLSTSTWHAGSAVTTLVNVFLKSVVMLLGYLYFMTTISWQLTILTTVTIPTVAIASKWYGRYLYSISVLEEQAVADGCAVGESALSTMPTIRSLGSEHVELAEFERYMRKFLAYNTKGAWAILGFSTCVDVLPELVVALVLYYGGLLVRSNGRGHITAGELFGFVLYLNAMTEKITDLGEMYTDLIRALGATDKVFELLKRESKLTKPSFVDKKRLEQATNASSKHFLGVNATKVIVNRVSGLHPPECYGGIVFHNVLFRYPARPKRIVLDGLNLVIPPGSIIALVGASGSGKSSIVKLIQHLYEPNTGTVSIDGTSVNELSPDWISRHVAVVQQEPVLFAHSIRKNIIYGLEGTDMEPTQDEVEEAARLANVASFIDGLPDGYNTQVGERGIQLSGGQKQRIAIARSVVRRPRILLLDEATSALDSESETAVQGAIDTMLRDQKSPGSASGPMRTMTVVIVAHRLSTVKNADRIVVLQQGQIVEEGSHNELTKNADGIYSTLIRKQLHSSFSATESN